MPIAYQFDEERHIYRVERAIVPGVTRVLDHSGLVDFSMVREEIRERTTERGKRVHAATHFHDENDLDLASVRDEERGYVDSWIGFRECSGYKPLVSERQSIASIDGHLFGMKVDSVGYFPRSNRLSIVDRKTGDVAWWVGVQTAGYAAGYEDGPADKSSPLARFLKRDRYAVRLFSDGRPGKLVKFEERKDYYAFAAALFLTHYKIAQGIKFKEIEDATN